MADDAASPTASITAASPVQKEAADTIEEAESVPEAAESTSSVAPDGTEEVDISIFG